MLLRGETVGRRPELSKARSVNPHDESIRDLASQYKRLYCKRERDSRLSVDV